MIRNSRDGAVRELLLMRWGMFPFFAKSPAEGIVNLTGEAGIYAGKRAWGRMLRLRKSGGKSGCVPLAKRVLEPLPVQACGGEMATQAEGSVERLKQREEALCVLWTSKMLLLSFLDPGWLMRVLGPII